VTPSGSARSVIDFAFPLSIWRRQRCARTSALINVSSRRGFGGGTADPSGIMISFRPPRRCSRSDVEALDEQPLDACLLGRVELVPDRLERAESLMISISWISTPFSSGLAHQCRSPGRARPQ
jgi:hypothetical protein